MRTNGIGLAGFLLMLGALHTSCLKVELNELDSSTPLGLITTLLLVPRTPGFLAVGRNCTAWSSQNGSSWTQLANSFAGCNGGGMAELYSVAYGNGTYVVVGSATNATDGCGIWTSRNGTEWTARSCTFAYALRAVAFSKSLGYFVTIGANSDGSVCDALVSNADASVWTVASSQPSCAGVAGNIRAKHMIAYGGGFMALTGTVSTHISGTGSSWAGTASTPVTTTNNALVGFSSGRIASLGFGGGFGAASTTDNAGSTAWSVNVPAAFTQDIKSGAVNSASFVGVAFNCRLARSGDNLATISAGVQDFGSNCSSIDWSAVVYSSSLARFVAGGNSSVDSKEQFAFSTTGDKDSWSMVPLSNTNQVNAIVAVE